MRSRSYLFLLSVFVVDAAGESLAGAHSTLASALVRGCVVAIIWIWFTEGPGSRGE